jgi:hypothetical protein
MPGGRRIAAVHDADAEATLARERALLLEALTLLVQRQAETESTMTDQIARTNARVVNVERRGTALEARVADIDARLRQLAIQVEPDPGLASRVAVLQAQLQQLHVARIPDDEPEPLQSSVVTSAPPSPTPTPPSPTPRTSLHAQAIRQPQAPPPRRDVMPPRRAVLVGSADALWDRLGTTNQDRASLVLIGTGVLVVVFAALAQLRPG